MPRVFRSLDQKVAVALLTMLDGVPSKIGLSTRLKKRRCELLYSYEEPLMGCEVVRMILDDMKTNEVLGVAHSVTDIAKVEWQGDRLEQMTHVRNIWDMLYLKVKASPGGGILDATLEHDLYEQVKNSSSLSYDISCYDRAVLGYDIRNMQFLLSSIDRYMARKTMEQNRKDELKAWNPILGGM